jgi:membrane protease YdiL (CAAX protease family)
MRRIYLTAELLLLFLALPLAVRAGWFGPFLLLPLLAGCTLCCTLLALDPAFRWGEVLHCRAAGREHRRMAAGVVLAAFVLACLTLLLSPETFLDLPRRHTLVWLAVLVLYPAISVVPQEIVFRTFLFHRYAPLLRTRRDKILASAVAFGFVHIVFGNWLAVTLTTAGGVLLAATYARSRSLWWVCIEHACYGALVFTVGLGRFFLGGTLSQPLIDLLER